MGAAGPLSLTDRETEAQADARATQPGGAVSRRARRGLKPRAGARRAQGHRAGGPREAGWVGIRRPPRARAPPSAARTGPRLQRQRQQQQVEPELPRSRGRSHCRRCRH